jgi:predicted dehydrogenase
MSSLPRRTFLQSTLAAGAAALVLPGRSSSQTLGANEDLRVACVGIRGRGNGHIRSFHDLPGVRVVALCDPDRNVLMERAQPFLARGESIGLYPDYRKLLERKDVDAIAVATPNHWHSLMSVWACQAGKHVYLEKPVSHNVWEGRQAVEAGRLYGRLVATGTQSRSAPGIREAIKWIHQERLGKVKVARSLCYKRRKSIGKVTEDQPIPEHIDYDLWTGPAPLGPLRREKLHYDWHWVWATGNGDIGNQGIHQMDIARWALQEGQLAPRVVSVGGRVGYDDDGETPNTQIALFDYEKAPLVFEVRGLETEGYKNVKIGNVVECENGHFTFGTGDARAFDNNGELVQHFKGSGNHFLNFVEAVRHGDPKMLHSDILEGHLSSALCHIANLSHRLGTAAAGAKVQEGFATTDLSGEALERLNQHLTDQGIDRSTTQLTLGRELALDPSKERFIDDAEANQQLTREYREPFVVPELA